MIENIEKHIENSRVEPGLLAEEELDRIEAANPDGLSSSEVIDVFIRAGSKFSEATFRKYVQLGLLPRSKRVGTKGKHKGSRGVYPVSILRQINEIKRLMALDYTIEDIRRHFAFIGGELEDLRSVLTSIFDKLDESLSGADTSSILGASLRRTLDEARVSADDLTQRLDEAAGRLREQARIAREAV